MTAQDDTNSLSQSHKHRRKLALVLWHTSAALYNLLVFFLWIHLSGSLYHTAKMIKIQILMDPFCCNLYASAHFPRFFWRGDGKCAKAIFLLLGNFFLISKISQMK